MHQFSERILIPIGIGYAIGITAVIIDHLSGGTAFIEQQLQVPACLSTLAAW
jgi:hypothetical protein